MNALDLLRRFEGFRETPYFDVNAHRVGYGSDTVTLADGRVVKVTPDVRVTREDAERDLERRVSTEFMPSVAKAVGPEAFKRLTEAQKASLASIAYNYGSLPHSVAVAVQSGDMGKAEAAIRALSSHNKGVNAKRRNAEADIFAGTSGLPGERDATPIAYAYANGKMTPEDAALYEKGAEEGLFPKVARPDPLDAYRASMAARPRPAVSPVTLAAAPAVNATPLREPFLPGNFRGL